MHIGEEDGAMTHTGPHLSRVSVGAGLALLALALGVGCTPPPALDAAPRRGTFALRAFGRASRDHGGGR